MTTPGYAPDFYHLTVRLPSDIADRIKALAAADERSVSFYVTRVLRNHVDRIDAQPRRAAV